MGNFYPLQCSNLSSPEDANNFLDAQEPLPFEEIFLPLVLDARKALRREVGVALYGLLTPLAHAGWERYLLSRLARVGAKAAHDQFQVSKTIQQVFPKNRSVTRQGVNSCYHEFVGDKPAPRLQKLLAEFPALSKLFHTLSENWLATVAEFLRRIDVDCNKFGSHFEGGNYAFPIATVRAGLSDPHRGGRCVARITFSDSAKLIYKPRSLAPEAHFSVLLAELNKFDIPHPLRSIRCWDRGEYGWMENVEESQCRTRTDVHAFYWQAGVLLGAIHLARGVDIHHENLVAASGGPVLIDLEALWHPLKVDQSNPTAVVSLLRTGFLPRGSSHSERIYDWGALSRQIISDRTVTTWVHINQDRMAYNVERRSFTNQGHLPVFADVPYLASSFVPDIQAGFKWLGEMLLNTEAQRNWFEEWLKALAKCPRRLIIHPTSQYQSMLEQVTQPQSLRGENILVNAAAVFTDNSRANLEGVVQAIKQFDVPYFEQDPKAGIHPGSPLLPGSFEINYASQIAVIAKSLEGDFYPESMSGPKDYITTTSKSCR